MRPYSASATARAALVVIVVGLLVLAPAVGPLAHTARAAAGDDRTFAVAQGTDCYVVEPYEDDERNVTTFYDYRNPNSSLTGRPPASTYSSYGTEEFQRTSESALLFYAGPEDTSLVVVHDRLGDEDGGSTVTYDVEGLPEGEWAVRDDQYYPETDDNWDVGDRSASIDWKWSDNRTDGGAYRGFDSLESTVVIDPAYNEEADAWGDWGYSGSDQYRMTGWTLYGVDGADGGERELALDRRVFVHPGGCEETPPDAAVDGPDDADPGETVTLDASGSSDDGTIAGYEWDVDGDGSVDNVTDGPTLDTAFDEEGEYTVRVTAFDRYGNGNATTQNVTVGDPGAPRAALSAPETAVVNETVTLDASGSSDDQEIDRYEWDVDGDGSVDNVTDGPTLDTAYERAGEYRPSVTVFDDSDQSSEANASVTVEEATPLEAELSKAPDSPAVDEPVTFEATVSGADDVREYAWDLDGDGAVDRRTDSRTTEFTYRNETELTATVTATDDQNRTATASVAVEVTSDAEATLSAPANATVGESVTLEADGSALGTVVSYEWDTDGDGSFETTTNASTLEHTYGAAGTYESTVRMTTESGTTGTANATVVASEPEAAIDAASTAEAGEPVTFDGDAGGADDSAYEFRWAFGDGTTANGTSVDHAYDAAGSYTVTMELLTDDGAVASTEFGVTVDDGSDGGSGGSDGTDGSDGSGNAGPSGGSGPSGGTGGSGNAGGSTGGGFAGGSADGTESEQVGEPEANFTNVSASVNTEELVVGDTLVVTASVRNVGNASGTKTVEFEVDGVDVETRRFTLEPDESRTVRFTREFAEPGEYTVEIDRNERFRVRVQPKRPDISVTDLEVNESTPTAGETVTFTAVVHNDGRAAGERTLNLTLFGETVDSRTVRLRPNVSQRVEFTRSIAAEGEYTATVGNRSATVSVVAAETGTDEPDTTATATSAPGFGVSVAVLALLVAAAAARRRGGG